jgi:hypothetical protein
LLTALLGASAGSPALAGAVEVPDPGDEPVFIVGGLKVEYQGTYTETYSAPGGGSQEAGGVEEKINYSFDTIEFYEALRWTAQHHFTYVPGDEPEIKGFGTYEQINEGQSEPITCTVTAVGDPEIALAPPLFPLEPEDGTGGYEPGTEGHVIVHSFLPTESNSYVTVKSKPSGSTEAGECQPVVGTPGTPTLEALVDLEPSAIVNLNENPAYAEPILDQISSHSGNSSDQLSIQGTLTVTRTDIERAKPSEPLEQVGPSTPIQPPKPPSSPPPIIIEPPAIEPREPVLGGGGPLKLETGIKPKCPVTASHCSVSGRLGVTLPVSGGGHGATTAKSPRARRPKARLFNVGSTGFTLAGGHSEEVTITLSRTGEKLLREHKRLPATVSVSVSAPGAATVTRTRALTLKLPTRHLHHVHSR